MAKKTKKNKPASKSSSGAKKTAKNAKSAPQKKSTKRKSTGSKKKTSTQKRATTHKKTNKKKAAPATSKKSTSSSKTTKKTKKTTSTNKKASKTSKSKATNRKKSPSSRNDGPKANPVKSPEKIKTRLKPEELEEFRSLLLAKRAELLGDIGHLENEAMRQGSSGEASESSFMPIHMADIGSDTWEQELNLGLIQNERGLVRDIDEALARIDEGTYGICLATGKPIAKSRLRVKPWAKYCIEYARKRELGLM